MKQANIAKCGQELVVIDGKERGNVILLPKTVDYYQEELTRMLETERYGEAVRLLDFLLDCRTEDPRMTDEWQELLHWLQTSFVEVEQELNQEGDGEDISERDMRKQQLYSKMANDPNYVKKLLETLLGNSGLDRKMAALEQLSLADHPHIDETLKRWLEQVELHPLIQFRVLQTLRTRSAAGTVALSRCGEQVELDIAATPLTPEEYPAAIRRIEELVLRACDATQPNLAYFVRHTWNECIAFVYGTSIYGRLAALAEESARPWAAALHRAVEETMSGTSSRDELEQRYGLNRGDGKASAAAYKLLKSVMSSIYGG